MSVESKIENAERTTTAAVVILSYSIFSNSDLVTIIVMIIITYFLNLQNYLVQYILLN